MTSSMHSAQGTESHHPSSKNLLLTIILNFLITLVQIIGGIFANSLSLISDALHNLSDGIAILIAFLAIRISLRKKDLKKTFGYKRAEILAALFNASLLIIISFFLFKEAILRFREPVVIDGMLMLGVASFGLLANLFCVLLLKRDSDKTINIKSAYLHLISDTVSSLAVIIGAVVIYFFKFYYIDSLFTVLIGVYVLREGYKILLETINILMQAAPKDIDINAILKEINTLPEIDNLHHVHIWQTNDRDIFFEGHIDLCHDYRLSEADAIRKKIEIILKEKFKIKHVTLQPEFDICEDKKIIPG